MGGERNLLAEYNRAANAEGILTTAIDNEETERKMQKTYCKEI